MEWKRDSSLNLIIFCGAILLCMISRMLYVTTLPRDEAYCEEPQDWNSLTKLERNIFGELLRTILYIRRFWRHQGFLFAYLIFHDKYTRFLEREHESVSH